MRSTISSYHEQLVEASRREQVKGFNRRASDFKPSLVNRKLERKAVDPVAIAKLLKDDKDKKKEKLENDRKKKEKLLEKRQEKDGGAYARRLLANQKATVKVRREKTRMVADF